MCEQKIKIGKTLLCGCCGMYFSVWAGYEDQDQDAGYGICKSCQKDDQEMVNRHLDDAIAQIKTSLKPENLKKFLAYDLQTQRGIAAKMIHDGVFGWSIS